MTLLLAVEGLIFTLIWLVVHLLHYKLSTSGMVQASQLIPAVFLGLFAIAFLYSHFTNHSLVWQLKVIALALVMFMIAEYFIFAVSSDHGIAAMLWMGYLILGVCAALPALVGIVTSNLLKLWVASP